MSLNVETAVRIVVFNVVYILLAVVVIVSVDLPAWVIVPVMGIIILWGIYAYRMNMRMLGMPPQYTGIQGAKGIAMTPIRHEGKVKVRGEIWQAWSVHPIKKGEKVKVVSRKGITIEVAPYDALDN